MTPHVPIARHLQLPPEFAHVPGYIARMDPDLRIRRSAERRDRFVIERRCRRAPAVNAGLRDVSDMHVQARDGYIHVSSVHRNWLHRPWNIVRALVEEGVDLWAKGAATFENELRYEEDWTRETRRRRRKHRFQEIGRDAYVMASRMGIGGERTRVSVPSVPAH